MTTVLTLIDHPDGAVARTSRETLTLARQLAEQADQPLHAVALAPVADEVVKELGELGASVVHSIEHPSLDADAAAPAVAEVLRQLMEQLAPSAVLGPASDRGAAVLAHLAARTDLPLAANCTAITPVETGWELTRVRWGGVLYEDAHLDAPTALLTVAPHQVAAAPATMPATVERRVHAPVLDDDLHVTRIVDREELSSGVSLATAPVVFAGGRGMGNADGFAILEELAGLLGGAVGCSRVATNAGWRSHNDQVGQTGTRVAPDLYVACGISGATQHWVGCMHAKRILAINTDPEAPMVTRADDAVVGDVHDFLPALVEEIRTRQG